jgi:hypothetical protein
MIPADLAQAVAERKVILFVGAGVSRSLGLPSWQALIARLASQLGYDPEVFTQYGTPLELAEYFELEQGTLQALSNALDREWHKDETLVDASAVHQLIVDINLPLIYTTNYDRWLEIAFERRGCPRAKIANVKDIARVSGRVGPQIVKFHGDFDTEGSLVFTEESYFNRLSLDTPMDTKLRHDALGHTVLFVGYSLSDINIRYLLFKIWRSWQESNYAGFQPKSYILLSSPNPVQEKLLGHRGVQVLVAGADDPTEGLKLFLESLRSVS